MAEGVAYKPLLQYVDSHSIAFGGGRGRSQAFGSRGNRLQAFAGIRESLFTSLLWQMVSLFTSLWRHSWPFESISRRTWIVKASLW